MRSKSPKFAFFLNFWVALFSKKFEISFENSYFLLKYDGVRVEDTVNKTHILDAANETIR